METQYQTNQPTVLLRCIVADPSRHRPLANHPSANDLLSQDRPTTTMYVLEARRRLISPEIYHVDMTNQHTSISTGRRQGR